MSEPNFASLSPTLLARKGGAKPAMRPQLAPLPENFGEGLDEDKLEDLGWNDMGGDEGDEHVAALDFGSHGDELIVDPLQGARVVSIGNRQPFDLAAGSPSAANEDTPAAADPLLRHEDKNPKHRVLADAAMEPADAGDAVDDDSPEDTAHGPLLRKPRALAAPSPRPITRDRSRATERRAAFTLRLDPERHLKLRLASTMQGVSAQALLTEALDAMLAEFEELDALAARMKRH
jgi:hypothetical protein